MERTTPVSNGWITLVRPLGTIFPVAEATMSIVPVQAQISATQNKAMIVAPTARPIGDGGVSTISSAAGRNASSSACRPRAFCAGMARRIDVAIVAAECRILAADRFNRQADRAIVVVLTDFMNPCLQTMQRCVAAAGLDQHIMGAVFDQPAALKRDDPIGRPHR